MKIFYFFLFVLTVTSSICSSAEKMVHGKNFEIPETQDVEFVPQKKYEKNAFTQLNVPRKIDLKNQQSAVQNQGQRGSCTYFTISSLLESLIIKKQNVAVNISEEYMAWAAKVKNKSRANEEDSSVAINAFTTQKFGFMLEKHLPYQESWLNKGMPCELQKNKKQIDTICFSHDGPSAENMNKIIDGSHFIFESVDSGSIDIIKTMARLKSPITTFILAHPTVWDNSHETGHLKLSAQHKKECQKNIANCYSHAVLLVGYDLDTKIFTFKNSWGTEWGNKGYGKISFSYMDQMSARKFITGDLTQNLDLFK